MDCLCQSGERIVWFWLISPSGLGRDYPPIFLGMKKIIKRIVGSRPRKISRPRFFFTFVLRPRPLALLGAHRKGTSRNVLIFLLRKDFFSSRSMARKFCPAFRSHVTFDFLDDLTCHPHYDDDCYPAISSQKKDCYTKGILAKDTAHSCLHSLTLKQLTRGRSLEGRVPREARWWRANNSKKVGRKTERERRDAILKICWNGVQ